MTIYLVTGVVAFLVSCLTLFSGFGLGTLLMPAFALFFPVDVAVTATAVVHIANSLFKSALLFGRARWAVVARFGLPAILAAFAGAWLLTRLSGMAPLAVWHAGRHRAEITPVGLVLGILILVFALLELWPQLLRLRLDARWLPLGGVLSGFFGGLSGHQGALRATFLRRLDLDPTEFAATQAVLAALVDVSRLVVYAEAFLAGTLRGFDHGSGWWVVLSAALCAFAGALLGRRLLPKMTLRGLRYITGVLLLLVGLGLATGLL